MKAITIRLSIATTAFLLLFGPGASAQTEHQHEQKKPAPQGTNQQHRQHDMSKMDMSGMMNEPHHVLAMSYMQNIATFAKALRDHATANTTVNGEFSRAAVEEIKRSFDQMEKHHKEHMQTMSEDMRSKMGATMTEIDMHRSKLKDEVAALEKDVKADAPDAKRLAADSNDILKHIDEMSKMHGEKAHKM